MSITFEDINSIPMTRVLDQCGIRYDRCWNTYKLYEGNHCTNGWVLNVRGNYVNDFSNNRAKGGPFSFVKQYFGFTNRETYEWFESLY